MAKAIWTGAAHDSDPLNPGNWENGYIPQNGDCLDLSNGWFGEPLDLSFFSLGSILFPSRRLGFDFDQIQFAPAPADEADKPLEIANPSGL